MVEFFESIKFHNVAKNSFIHFKFGIAAEHNLTATELVSAFLIEKNTVSILSFWKSAVHNFFSNAFLDKPYHVLGHTLLKPDIERILTASRLRVVRGFGECLKLIGKNKLGRFIHRMASLNPMKAPGLVPGMDSVHETIQNNLGGLAARQGESASNREIGRVSPNLKFRISVIGLFGKFHLEFEEMQKLILHWFFVSSTKCEIKFFSKPFKRLPKSTGQARRIFESYQLAPINIDFGQNLTPIDRIRDTQARTPRPADSLRLNTPNLSNFPRLNATHFDNPSQEYTLNGTQNRPRMEVHSMSDLGARGSPVADDDRSLRSADLLERRRKGENKPGESRLTAEPGLFSQKNLEHYLEFYQKHKFQHSEMNLRKLFLNQPYLFTPFDNSFLFVPRQSTLSPFFAQIKKNFKELKSQNLEHLKKEIAELKFKTVRKVFCNSLWTDKNPLFMQEMLWRFLISSPKSFCDFFKKEPKPEQLKLMVEHGFIKNIKVYRKLVKKLQRAVETTGKVARANLRRRSQRVSAVPVVLLLDHGRPSPGDRSEGAGSEAGAPIRSLENQHSDAQAGHFECAQLVVHFGAPLRPNQNPVEDNPIQEHFLPQKIQIQAQAPEAAEAAEAAEGVPVETQNNKPDPAGQRG